MTLDTTQAGLHDHEYIMHKHNGYPKHEHAIRAERPALDVERLARAMHATGIGCRKSKMQGCRVSWHRPEATAFVREYARLAAQPASEPPETGG